MNCQVTLSTVLDVVPMVISYANDTVWIDELTVVFSDISLKKLLSNKSITTLRV